MKSIQIPRDVEEIIGALEKNGYEAYAVGGCVRDTLLGRKPEDWDITTSASPQNVKSIFPRTVDTGIQHGTVTVMKNRQGYEVTTYRIDGEYEDSRHPKTVEFTSDLLEDLKRRDFTINAMAFSYKTGIVDRFGGIEDLKNKVIRCVGQAECRFTEDALRILRAVRFAAQLDFSIEADTYEAIKRLAPNLSHVSRERVQAELTKLLLSPNPQRIALVHESGVSPYVSTEFHKLDWGKIHISANLPAVKHLRWAAFLKEASEEAAVRILKDLKMDNDTIFRARTLVRWFPQPLKAEKPFLRRVMSQMEPSLYDDLLTLKSASLNETDGEMKAKAAAKGGGLEAVKELSRQIRENGDCVYLKDLAVTGADVMEAGVKPGKAVGDCLSRLLELVLETPEKNDRQYLLEEIKHDI